MPCGDTEENGCDSGCCAGTMKADETSSKNEYEDAKTLCSGDDDALCCPLDADGEDDGPDVLTCIGLIAKDGSTIAIYDVKGELQTFSLPNGDIRSLCFSSHGHNAGDLLTPCFDDEGLHGEPEEGCFCGIDTPHLHAHIHDPKICDDHNSTTDDNNNSNNDLENDLMLLARLTLHPTKVSSSSSITVAELRIPLDEAKKDVNNKCNSMDYSPVEPRGGAPAEIRVLHGDHYDFLVYNHRTKELHLEHS
ncbi:MAG: hypothetical protein SGARI_006425, partial [Bacillariaceae sp.]